MKLKILKLINNERINKKLISAKTCNDSTATDECSSLDYADCTLHAIDRCSKEDHGACSLYSLDICSLDTDACSGGMEDL